MLLIPLHIYKVSNVAKIIEVVPLAKSLVPELVYIQDLSFHCLCIIFMHSLIYVKVGRLYVELE